MLCFAVAFCATLYYAVLAVPFYSLSYHASLCFAMLWNIAHCCAKQYCALLLFAVPFYPLLHHALRYFATPFDAVLYYTVLFKTVVRKAMLHHSKLYSATLSFDVPKTRRTTTITATTTVQHTCRHLLQPWKAKTATSTTMMTTKFRGFPARMVYLKHYI